MTTPIKDATVRAAADTVVAFYDYGSQYGPGWRPFDALNGTYAGTPMNRDGTAQLVRPRDGNLWMTCQIVNADYWLWKSLGDVGARQRIINMANNLFASDGGYTQPEMNSDGSGDGSVSLFDDGVWKVRMMAQIFELTGDQRYWQALQYAVPAILRRFQGQNPNSNKVQLLLDNSATATDPSGSPFYYWLHGAAYNDNPSNSDSGLSVFYEATLASTCMDIFTKFGGSEAYYKYAYATYFRMKSEFAPKSGQNAYGHGAVFYNNYVFSAGTSGQAGFGYPKAGSSALSFMLSCELAVLANRLRLNSRTSAADKATLLQDMKNIVAAMQQEQDFYGFTTSSRNSSGEGYTPITGIFLPWEDSWTAAGSMPVFASEVLPTAGVDPNNTCALIVAKTAASALNTRTSASIALTSHFRYTADWAGQLQDSSGQPKAAQNGLFIGYTGYEPQQIAHPGSTGSSLAGSQQIMTNAMALSAAIAGAIVEARSDVSLPAYTFAADQLVDHGVDLADNQINLVDE
jgi:hypothetical protein